VTILFQKSAVEDIDKVNPTVELSKVSTISTNSVITCREYIFYLLGLNINKYVSVVEQRKENLPKFCMSTNHWLHADTRTCAPFLAKPSQPSQSSN
jgi:hypothetical protein